jgi:pimeloyl-ACP methyl ester carboxylesterase
LKIERDALLNAARADAELLYKLRGLTATIRLDLGDDRFDVRIADGMPVHIGDIEGAAQVSIAGPAGFWAKAFVPVPEVGYESLSVGGIHGVTTQGDFERHLAPYQGALQRLFLVLRKLIAGPTPRVVHDPEPYRDTDTAVGRYVYARNGDEEARVYYEETGAGPIALVLQHTAGADGRQYRHVLANPELQKRFRMIAWDLPRHGKSLPPIGSRWWEQDYRPTKSEMLGWNVAIAKALKLDRPIYLGCSVGGQLALDLAAHHADQFRGFVSVNGWYEIVSRGRYDNDIHRKPTTSTDFFASRILAATAPQAPEASSQEVYWVYRSNTPGVYAGDNDYFMNLHDLREDGHLIDSSKTPVYVVTGEYDGSQLYPENGGAAVARHIPGVVHRVLPGLGHFAPSDDPVRFCEAIVPILDEVVARCG